MGEWLFPIPHYPLPIAHHSFPTNGGGPVKYPGQDHGDRGTSRYPSPGRHRFGTTPAWPHLHLLSLVWTVASQVDRTIVRFRIVSLRFSQRCFSFFRDASTMCG